jgi:peptide/nickel transport system substrate-binding protein
MSDENQHDDESTGSVFDRRSFLKVGGGALVTASLGGGLTGRAFAASDIADASGKEAPSLAALVKAGTLPPLAKRLPKNPQVVAPVSKLGVYGGTLRTAAVGTEDLGSWIVMTTFYENMLAFRLPWKGKGSLTDVKPNIAESFTYNHAGTEFTYKLRKGMRWSDGAPFTADDVVFAVNDLGVNKVLHPHPQARLSGRDGSGCHAEKIDTYTVKLVYPTPNSIAPQGVCSAGGFFLHAPAHYLNQFHIDHNPNANDLAKSLGFSDWVALINAKSDPFNFDRPTVAAWKYATPYAQGTQTVFERNPYYWKVDTKGRQLPYIDKWVFTVSSSPEVELGQVLNGQVDLLGRLINTPANKPVLAQSRSKGKYDFFQLDTSFMNQGLIMLNQTAADPNLRTIFRNKDFRIGLSYAINRTELVQTVFAGQGEPWQQAPKKDSPWYDAKMAKQYTQFSLAQANQSLDKAGYALKNGARIGPDGKPISFIVECANNTPQMAAMLQLIQKTWAQVGIDMNISNVTEDLYFQRQAANQQQGAMFGASGGDNPILYAGSYIPLTIRGNTQAALWGLWKESVGTKGEGPPQWVRDTFTLYNGLLGTTNPVQQKNLMARLLGLVRDNFPNIGTVSAPVGYGIVSNRLKNVPKYVPGNLTFANVGPTHPEQYFLTK